MEQVCDFDFYLKFTKPLILSLSDINDRVLAAAWVKRLVEDKDAPENLKLDYLKLLLFALQRKKLASPFSNHPHFITVLTPFPPGQPLVETAKNIIKIEYESQRYHKESGDNPPYISDFSANLLEYVAVQKIRNFGVHGYYAVSKQPLNTWDRIDKHLLPRAAKSMLEVTVTPPALIETLSTPDLTEVIVSPEKRPPKSPEKPPEPPESPAKPEEEPPEKPPDEPVTPKKKKITPRKHVSPPSLGIGKLPPQEDREPPSWGSNLLEVKDAFDEQMEEKVKHVETELAKEEKRVTKSDIFEDRWYEEDIHAESPPSFMDRSMADQDMSFLEMRIPSPPPPFAPLSPLPSPLRPAVVPEIKITPATPQVGPPPKKRFPVTKPTRASLLLQKKKAELVKPPAPSKKPSLPKVKKPSKTSVVEEPTEEVVEKKPPPAKKPTRIRKPTKKKPAPPAAPALPVEEPFKGFAADEMGMQLAEFNKMLQAVEKEYKRDIVKYKERQKAEKSALSTTKESATTTKHINYRSFLGDQSKLRVPHSSAVAVSLDQSIHISPEARHILHEVEQAGDPTCDIRKQPAPRLSRSAEEDDFEAMEKMIEEEMRREGLDPHAKTGPKKDVLYKDYREGRQRFLDVHHKADAQLEELTKDDFEAMEKMIEEEMRREGLDPHAKTGPKKDVLYKDYREGRQRFLDVHHKIDAQLEELTKDAHIEKLDKTSPDPSKDFRVCSVFDKAVEVAAPIVTCKVASPEQLAEYQRRLLSPVVEEEEEFDESIPSPKYGVAELEGLGELDVDFAEAPEVSAILQQLQSEEEVPGNVSVLEAIPASEEDFETLENMIEEEMRRQGLDPDARKRMKKPSRTSYIRGKEKLLKIQERVDAQLDQLMGTPERHPSLDDEDFEMYEKMIEEEMKAEGLDPNARNKKAISKRQYKEGRKHFFRLHHKIDKQMEELEGPDPEKQQKILEQIEEAYKRAVPHGGPPCPRTPPMFSKHQEVREAAQILRYPEEDTEVWTHAPTYFETVGKEHERRFEPKRDPRFREAFPDVTFPEDEDQYIDQELLPDDFFISDGSTEVSDEFSFPSPSPDDIPGMYVTPFIKPISSPSPKRKIVKTQPIPGVQEIRKLSPVDYRKLLKGPPADVHGLPYVSPAIPAERTPYRPVVFQPTVFPPSPPHAPEEQFQPPTPAEVFQKYPPEHFQFEYHSPELQYGTPKPTTKISVEGISPPEDWTKKRDEARKKTLGSPSKGFPEDFDVPYEDIGGEVFPELASPVSPYSSPAKLPVYIKTVPGAFDVPDMGLKMIAESPPREWASPDISPYLSPPVETEELVTEIRQKAHVPKEPTPISRFHHKRQRPAAPMLAVLEDLEALDEEEQEERARIEFTAPMERKKRERHKRPTTLEPIGEPVEYETSPSVGQPVAGTPTQQSRRWEIRRKLKKKRLDFSQPKSPDESEVQVVEVVTKVQEKREESPRTPERPDRLFSPSKTPEGFRDRYAAYMAAVRPPVQEEASPKTPEPYHLDSEVEPDLGPQLELTPPSPQSDWKTIAQMIEEVKAHELVPRKRYHRGTFREDFKQHKERLPPTIPQDELEERAYQIHEEVEAAVEEELAQQAAAEIAKYKTVLDESLSPGYPSPLQPERHVPFYTTPPELKRQVVPAPQKQYRIMPTQIRDELYHEQPPEELFYSETPSPPLLTSLPYLPGAVQYSPGGMQLATQGEVFVSPNIFAEDIPEGFISPSEDAEVEAVTKYYYQQAQAESAKVPSTPTADFRFEMPKTPERYIPTLGTAAEDLVSPHELERDLPKYYGSPVIAGETPPELFASPPTYPPDAEDIQAIADAQYAALMGSPTPPRQDVGVTQFEYHESSQVSQEMGEEMAIEYDGEAMQELGVTRERLAQLNLNDDLDVNLAQMARPPSPEAIPASVYQFLRELDAIVNNPRIGLVAEDLKNARPGWKLDIFAGKLKQLLRDSQMASIVKQVRKFAGDPDLATVLANPEMIQTLSLHPAVISIIGALERLSKDKKFKVYIDQSKKLLLEKKKLEPLPVSTMGDALYPILLVGMVGGVQASPIKRRAAGETMAAAEVAAFVKSTKEVADNPLTKSVIKDLEYTSKNPVVNKVIEQVKAALGDKNVLASVQELKKMLQQPTPEAVTKVADCVKVLAENAKIKAICAGLQSVSSTFPGGRKIVQKCPACVDPLGALVLCLHKTTKGRPVKPSRLAKRPTAVPQRVPISSRPTAPRRPQPASVDVTQRGPFLALLNEINRLSNDQSIRFIVHHLAMPKSPDDQTLADTFAQFQDHQQLCYVVSQVVLFLDFPENKTLATISEQIGSLAESDEIWTLVDCLKNYIERNLAELTGKENAALKEDLRRLLPMVGPTAPIVVLALHRKVSTLPLPEGMETAAMTKLIKKLKSAAANPAVAALMQAFDMSSRDIKVRQLKEQFAMLRRDPDFVNAIEELKRFIEAPRSQTLAVVRNLLEELSRNPMIHKLAEGMNEYVLKMIQHLRNKGTSGATNLKGELDAFTSAFGLMAGLTLVSLGKKSHPPADALGGISMGGFMNKIQELTHHPTIQLLSKSLDKQLDPRLKDVIAQFRSVRENPNVRTAVAQLVAILKNPNRQALDLVVQQLKNLSRNPEIQKLNDRILALPEQITQKTFQSILPVFGAAEPSLRMLAPVLGPLGPLVVLALGRKTGLPSPLPALSPPDMEEKWAVDMFNQLQTIVNEPALHDIVQNLGITSADTNMNAFSREIEFLFGDSAVKSAAMCIEEALRDQSHIPLLGIPQEINEFLTDPTKPAYQLACKRLMSFVEGPLRVYCNQLPLVIIALKMMATVEGPAALPLKFDMRWDLSPETRAEIRAPGVVVEPEAVEAAGYQLEEVHLEEPPAPFYEPHLPYYYDGDAGIMDEPEPDYFVPGPSRHEVFVPVEGDEERLKVIGSPQGMQLEHEGPPESLYLPYSTPPAPPSPIPYMSPQPASPSQLAGELQAHEIFDPERKLMYKKIGISGVKVPIHPAKPPDLWTIHEHTPPHRPHVATPPMKSFTEVMAQADAQYDALLEDTPPRVATPTPRKVKPSPPPRSSPSPETFKDQVAQHQIESDLYEREGVGVYKKRWRPHMVEPTLDAFAEEEEEEEDEGRKSSPRPLSAGERYFLDLASPPDSYPSPESPEQVPFDYEFSSPSLSVLEEEKVDIFDQSAGEDIDVSPPFPQGAEPYVSPPAKTPPLHLKAIIPSPEKPTQMQADFAPITDYFGLPRVVAHRPPPPVTPKKTPVPKAERKIIRRRLDFDQPPPVTPPSSPPTPESEGRPQVFEVHAQMHDPRTPPQRVPTPPYRSVGEEEHPSILEAVSPVSPDVGDVSEIWDEDIPEELRRFKWMDVEVPKPPLDERRKRYYW